MFFYGALKGFLYYDIGAYVGTTTVLEAFGNAAGVQQERGHARHRETCR